MSFINLLSNESLLKLRDKISSTQHNVFFETGPVLHPKKIQYRLRKATGMRKKLERNFDGEIAASGTPDAKGIGFWNLSHTAYLVIPTTGYLHVSEFAKKGSEEEWMACWDIIRREINKGEYISTHGFGVAWVHFRIEKNPKYYEW